MLLTTVFLHLVAIIVTELRERIGLVSSMFNGEKIFTKKPFDLEG
jgi:hypothetical protein